MVQVHFRLAMDASPSLTARRSAPPMQPVDTLDDETWEDFVAPLGAPVEPGLTVKQRYAVSRGGTVRRAQTTVQD